MPQSSTTWSDVKVERVIGRLLQTGLMLAASVVLAGGICYLFRHGASRTDYRVFRGEPSELRSVAGILHGIASRRCRDLIQLGLVLLIATPVARVAFSVFAFAKERDYTYVAITLVVLAILIYSLAGGPSAGLR
ncbi:MAG TPA: DUF1634 domain-containing protein [Bryobacteraceae bacterium]|nr:DUF1634 domain-containing protein [Bryobacteraceae bacterium]